MQSNPKRLFREARISDIQQIQLVRHSVKENVLSDPALVTDEDCEIFLSIKGKGWVCETDTGIVGFAIVDLSDHNIWALFVRPAYAGMGIGKQLHNRMLDWYFRQTTTTVWLGTAPHTRAAAFYRNCGWSEVGMHGDGELKFEMTFKNWSNKKQE